jgi:hypothetical protein
VNAVAEPLEYTEGAGPGIPELPEMTAEDAAAAQNAGGEVLAPEHPGWELEHMELLLNGIGEGLHLLWGIDDEDWKMTRRDLERMAPPMQRIANRYEPTLRASAYADPIMLGYGGTLYVWRNVLLRARLLRDQQEEPAGAPAAARYERAPDEEPAQGLSPDESEPAEYRPMFPKAAVRRLT